jgi:2-oxoisovalerate dehydrogenase E1 component alpha subunit
MGMGLIDGIRQMAMARTDPHSMGRNFPGHYARRDWNVIPICSVIGIQYAKAVGTAIVQKRFGGDSITIVSGGDAGTAEGDFSSCMIWSTRPGNEVPVLIIVTNNHWGISTPAGAVHAEGPIINRGAAFGIPGEVVDGNDPVASWYCIQRGMEYCRTKRKPFMIEAFVSRLYGHSSSSGALRVKGEADCIEQFEKKLLAVGVLDPEILHRTHEEAKADAETALEQVLKEPKPRPEDVYRYTYAPSRVDPIYPEDYTGLPPSDWPEGGNQGD